MRIPASILSQATAQALARWRAGVDIPAIVLLVSLACGSAGTRQAVAAESPTPKAYQLKAAFLYNFTKFVQWPTSCFVDAKSPVVLGVFSSNPFGAELENIVKDRKLNERGFVVRVVRTPDEAKEVHVLFVPAGEEKSLPGLLESLRDAPVLTVGEAESFARLGGVITFAMEQDKVRFDINAAAAERAGLRISAQLQKLARKVRQ